MRVPEMLKALHLLMDENANALCIIDYENIRFVSCYYLHLAEYSHL